MLTLSVLGGLCVGLIGGVTSGLLGVSPGGALVVGSILILGSEQHVAQGVSLIAQIPPTSAAGIKRYWSSGKRVTIRWLAIMSIGFLVGGMGGAFAAGRVSSSFLRWTYVVYLVALDLLIILRTARYPRKDVLNQPAERIHFLSLLIVGAIAGFSSGFLGIGGGLAITVGLTTWLKVAQHQAQLISLAMSIVPMTIPAAYIYWREGWSLPWLAIVGVILGLGFGADFGARFANRMSEASLRRCLVCFVSAMAIYMACKSFPQLGAMLRAKI